MGSLFPLGERHRIWRNSHADRAHTVSTARPDHFVNTDAQGRPPLCGLGKNLTRDGQQYGNGYAYAPTHMNQGS